jgi:cyclopropane fatty-acyl-phospholipid synthase-like methyltransferase
MIFSTISILLTLALTAMVIIPVFYGAPWYPASRKDIYRALKLCEAQSGEKLYDLGSGDGRVLKIAAQDFGMEAIGLEIDPIKVWLSKQFLPKGEFSNRIKILRQNVFEFDFEHADTVFIYMTHQALDQLFPKILETLKPTATIACYRFCLRGIQPDKVTSDKKIFIYRFNKGKSLNAYS